jgi:hypothetical protein
MNRPALKVLVVLLACAWLAGLPGCAAPDQPPQTMGDWMALDQVQP